MNNNNNLLFLLPADITIDILSRLPVESVLQCKCVCRSWETLINDPVFGHTHTERLLLHLDHHHQQQQQHSRSSADDNNNNNNISFRFILRTSKEDLYEYNYGEYNIDHLGSSTFRLKKPGPFPLEELSHKDERYHMHPVDSCNGLICLVTTYRDDHNMCVYNPLTTECVNLLPRFMVNGGSSSSLFNSSVATGFGYHPGTKEYKIVRIYYENYMSCLPGQVSVYTLGSGACGGGGGWISKGETSHMLSRSGVFANGALHWLANAMLVGFNKYIVSFDMVNEKFRIIPSPPPNVHDIYLGVLEGCLSATGINSDCPKNSSDVWVMSKDNKWSKKYNIPWKKPKFPYRYNPPLGLAPPPPPPPPLLKKAAAAAAAAGDDNINNKILLHYRWMGMVSYDKKKRCLDHGNVHKLKLVSDYDLIPCMKSFASLKALGEDGERIGGRTAAAAAATTTATSTTTEQHQLIISRKRKRT